MIEFRIPQGISVLSMIHNNPQMYEDFREDGWVYVNDKPVRKWYINLDGPKIRFWHPKLDDLAYCEEKRWKAVQIRKKEFANIWNDIHEQVKRFGDFICHYNNRPVAVRRYINDYGISVIGWGSVDDDDLPVNQELGDTYFAIEERVRQVNERKRWFGLAFMRALEKHWYNSNPDPMIRNFHYVINGRDYWFTESPNRFPMNRIEIISYPEDVVTTVI